MSDLKTVVFFLCISFSFLSNGLQKKEIDDGIVIVINAGPEILSPVRELPLICGDPTDTVLYPSNLLSFFALAGTTLYGIATHPTGFSGYACGRKYWKPLQEQSRRTNFPCKMEAGWTQCISDLVDKQCAADKITYDHEFPDKQIAAWAPLMVAGAATIGFQGGWLLGKWISRHLNRKSRIPFGPAHPTAIEMEEV